MRALTRPSAVDSEGVGRGWNRHDDERQHRDRDDRSRRQVVPGCLRAPMSSVLLPPEGAGRGGDGLRRSWATIAADLPVEAGLNARNLRDHFANGHLPIHEPTVRALADRQAAERGYVVEQAVEIAVDYLGFCHTVVGTVSKGVLNGKIRPTVRDGIAAAALLARYDPGPDIDRAEYAEAFAAYHSTVADVLTSEQFAELGNRYANDPVLKELSRQWEERHG